MAAADESAAWPLSSAVVDDLAECEAGAGPAATDLVDVLAGVADPRQCRWVVHPVPVVLALSAAAVIAGMRSFTAIAEWASEAPESLRAWLYDRCGVVAPGQAPSKSTIWRVLTDIDADAADAVIGTWLTSRHEHDVAEPEPAEGRTSATALAVDGKTVRGAVGDGGQQTHLLAVATQDGIVTGQVSVAAKTNEIPMLPVLLGKQDITGTVLAADALHTQRDTVAYLHSRGAEFCLCVKENQPNLYAALNALPWHDTPIAHSHTERGHGRIERRTIRVLPPPAELDFPHVAQAMLIERYITHHDGTSPSAIAVLAITSLTAEQANPDTLARYIRSHWSIESLHWLRDTVYREDDSRARTQSGPQTMAGLRNLAIGALRLAGRSDITTATRSASRAMHRPLQLLGLTR